MERMTFKPKFEVSGEDKNMKEYLKDYKTYRDGLIRAAVLARNNAVSHRPEPFKVGCTLMAKDEETKNLEGEYAVYSAYNFKPENIKVSGYQKRCAERNAVDAALKKKLEIIIAIVTVSKEVSTGDESKSCTALHPCRDCRDMIRELKSKGFLKGNSVICNVNDAEGFDKLYIEEKSVNDLLDLYEDDLKEEKK